MCVYYCRTYYKAVRGGGRRRVEDIAMIDDEPRTVWMSRMFFRLNCFVCKISPRIPESMDPSEKRTGP